MALVYDDDERMLADSARAFYSAQCSVADLRRLRDEGDAAGFSRELWQRMVEMGWSGLLVPEEFGGMGFSHVGAGILCELGARALVPSPLFSSAILAATLIGKHAGNAQKSALLPAMVQGQRLFALALDECPRHDPLAICTRAERSGDGFKLNGSKTLVIDGHVADSLIVVARTGGEPGESGGLSLFLLDPRAAGVSVERTIMVDSRNAARVSLDSVSLPGEALLGAADTAWASIEYALDVARACLAAEMLGIADEVFARTLDYLKQRRQFGAVIGSFQALQHRLAQLFCEIELARSAVVRCLRAVDEGSEELPALASLAKARLAETATLAVNEALQMHGGIGMTDEFEIGFFMKRVATLRQLFGDTHYHVDRFASLGGY